MVHYNNHHQHLQKQQITQQPNVQLPRVEPNIHQQQERTFVSRPANPQPQQPLFAAVQGQSRTSQPSMPPGLQQRQQFSGAGSDMLRMQRNPNGLHRVQRNGLVSPQQTPQLHQQPHFQKGMDSRFTGLIPQQNGMINQQKPLNQSEIVLPKDSSALSDSTPSNQSARITDWHDRVYDKVQRMRNMYSGKLDEIYRKARVLRSQNPGKATICGSIEIFVETVSKDFVMSREEFVSLSKENIHKLIRRMMKIESCISSFNNGASRQHRQPPPGSQSQLPEQQMNMKITKSEAATSHQMPAHHSISNSQANKVNATNAGSVANPELEVAVKLPIQQALLDPKNQLMSGQKKACDGSKLGQVVQNTPGILKQQDIVDQIRASSHLIAKSPQTSQQPSSQVRQEIRSSPLSTVRTSLPKVASEPNGSSKSSLLNSVKHSSAISSRPATGSVEHAQGVAKDDQIISQTTNKSQETSSGSLKILASPLMQEVFVPEETQKGISNESAVQRLLEVVKSMSNEALCATVGDISSIMNTIDIVDGATVDCESGAFACPENLLHEGKLDSLSGIATSRRMKRHFDVISTPAEVTPSLGLQELSRPSNYLDSTAEHRTKMPRFQHNDVVLDEIKETNKRLVETVLDVVSDSIKNTSNADIDGATIVRCSYTPVGLGTNIRLRKSSSSPLPLFCVQLLVPPDYPKSCPVLLNNSSQCGSFSEECDLTKKVNVRFSSSLCELSQSPSLEEMARRWDECARSVLAEFAVSIGGGSFSTKYGRWESCI